MSGLLNLSVLFGRPAVPPGTAALLQQRREIVHIVLKGCDAFGVIRREFRYLFRVLASGLQKLATHPLVLRLQPIEVSVLFTKLPEQKNV